MFSPKPTFNFLKFSLKLILIFSLVISNIYADENSRDPDEDLKDLEDLIALDEQVDQEKQQEEQGSNQHVKTSSEAEVLSKAQRIVLELNNDNTKRVIDENEFVFVLGYAPWCTRSAELMPKFAEAAMTLKVLDSPVLMAKVDADRYTRAAKVLGIKGFPTLLLFVNGSSQIYSGGFTAEEIVIWTRKKTGVPVIRISSVAAAEEFLKKHQTFVVGQFDKFEGPDYEEFVKAATADNEIQFAEVSDTDTLKVLFPDAKDGRLFLGLVKSEPEKYTTYKETFQMDKILHFLDYNKFPLVATMTELNSVRLYASPIKLQVFIFAEIDDFKNLRDSLEDVARKFKSKIMFIYIDIKEENLAKPLLTLFGLEESDKTIVAAFDNRISSKYLLESDLTQNNIEEFCMGLLDGTVPPYYKSQPIPENREGSIQVVVGKTFEELVLKSPKNILLEVHTPWCILCESTSKQVEKLFKHFKGLNSLTFARMDASANEHPDLQVDDYPTLLFYPAGDKSKPVTILGCWLLLIYSRFLKWHWLMKEPHLVVQMKLSTKAGIKELAAAINKHVKAEDKLTRDEL
ncbi:Thioredoxin domain [Dillenia turbinata]|uniref:protein disulfide-isomerase n=1 Tax=Dillenia turbinata TaxID=194707 RepID=A0AAN8YVT6_9MAGN